MSSPPQPTKIALIGAGTIGLSFAALHLSKNPTCTITIYDTRPDLSSYVAQHLPSYLVDVDDHESCTRRLTFATSLEEAVRGANIVQEQGPENSAWKVQLWPQVEKFARKEALLWSSTSGIPASEQSAGMEDKTRLVVCHPYNPPHIMPLLEVVRSPSTSDTVVEQTLAYWRRLGRAPVVVRKECVGFVANRLAFALFREACSLVAQGVVGVEECDEIVRNSMGPRWAVAGPFKAYHAGGGEKGLRGFVEKEGIGGTVEKCWRKSEEDAREGNVWVGEEWQEEVCRLAEEAYGVVDTRERDEKTRRVLDAVR
ncbi:unnamed protein product [Zymoseptoria tritici ST99CH_1A5]|uniref:3-hydroxyacyl-CoA dehydrogenase NAD binding domain-containing protein n=3 Tax=Zymoseptoria tritici TaxID=1047171 RepID=A0A1X7RW53_ZYMT9|nr:unnamed protein product [Zymoseptoria tritici ST99CH_3D7]SMR53921.1 unnamed protein product [Zymoseptoria tritici ST99CH_1E4]SMR56143.1 unnamed protein product [Zymoseptoria tritici ST99CH_3D1]SMY25326.1 unnamed protein product [Zymoseptoria tritici ST99CH_1A5]